MTLVTRGHPRARQTKRVCYKTSIISESLNNMYWTSLTVTSISVHWNIRETAHFRSSTRRARKMILLKQIKSIC